MNKDKGIPIIIKTAILTVIFCSFLLWVAKFILVDLNELLLSLITLALGGTGIAIFLNDGINKAACLENLEDRWPSNEGK